MTRPINQSKIAAVAVLMLTLLLGIPLTASQDPLPPGPDQVVQLVEDAADGALDIVYGDPLVGDLLPTPEALRAEVVLDSVDSIMDTVKSSFLLGDMEFRDFEDIDIDELTLQEGPLPDRIFYNSDLLGIELPDLGDGGGGCTSTGGGVQTGGSGGGRGYTTSDDGGTSCSTGSGSSSGSSGPSTTQTTQAQLTSTLEGDDEDARRAARNALMALGPEWTRYEHLAGVVATDPPNNETPVPPFNPEVDGTSVGGDSGGFMTMSSGSILFQDDFNDNSLNSAKWTVTNNGYGVSESNQRLEMKVRENMESRAEVKSSAFSATFGSTSGVDANVRMARHVEGDAWAGNVLFRLVKTSNPNIWVEIGYHAWTDKILLKDSSGNSYNLVSDGNVAGYHDFRLVVTGNQYTGHYGTYSHSVSSSLFSGSTSAYIVFQDNAATGSTGAWEKSARDNVVVYSYSASSNSSPSTPSTPSGSSSGSTGTTYWYSTSATDSNGDTIRYIFDWGDGTTGTTGYYASGTTGSKSKQWSSPGTYSVRVKAEDSQGAQSGWSGSKSVTISSSNSAPSTPSKPSGDASVTAGITETYSTSAMDSDGDTIRYFFDWGDGTSTWTGFKSSGATAQASKKWNTAGTYSVKVKAEDSNGAQSGWSPSLSVTVSSSGGSGSQTLYSTDFESGTTGWSLDGKWHRTTRKAYDGSYSLWYGSSSTGDYSSGSNANSGKAVSPTFSLPSGSNPVLTFRSWYETEPHPDYDKKWVEIRSSTGTLLASYPPIDGPMQQWSLKSYNLADFAGQNIRIHFKFDTIDHLNNYYEGWYIDSVKVQTTSGNVPSNSEPSMTSFTTEYYNTGSSGTSWFVYKNDGGYHTKNAQNIMQEDVASKNFRVDMEQHPSSQTAWISMWVANTGCSGSPSVQRTHILSVNGVPLGAFDPCHEQFSSQHQWTYLNFPAKYLKDGQNSISIMPNQATQRGLIFGVDDTYEGVDSYIKDNGVEKDGELLWRLWVTRPFDYDMMYRFLVVETIDENGKRSQQYAMEGFAHHSLDDLDSMYFLVYDDEGGERSRVWQSTTWQQNNDYSEANKHPQTKHWPHYRYDFNDKHNGQGGRQSPVVGEYYHWYNVQWGTRDSGGATTTDGRQIVLVDHAEGAPKTYNQYPDRVHKPNNIAPLIDIEVSAYWEVDKVMEYWHKGWNNKDGKYPWPGRTTTSGAKHAHDHIGFEVQVFDFSKAMNDAAQAAGVADKILKGYVDYQSGVGMEDWIQKQLKIEKSGALISWLLTTLQTGNVLHIIRSEWDTGTGGGTMPWTDTALHPIIPAPIVGPVMMAVDLIPVMGHQVYSHPDVTDPPVAGQGWRWEWTAE